MVEIKGHLKCNACSWEEENVEAFFQCPHCHGANITHTPPHKILLCLKQNVEGHGCESGKLSNIHKKILKNIRGKLQTYQEILRLVKSDKRVWTSIEVINSFGVQGFTDGDVIRSILDLLVCEGHLKKVFMVGKKYHSYDSNTEIERCPFLDCIVKGKREGVYKCKFDFKNEGKELDARDVFLKNGDKNPS